MTFSFEKQPILVLKKIRSGWEWEGTYRFALGFGVEAKKYNGKKFEKVKRASTNTYEKMKQKQIIEGIQLVIVYRFLQKISTKWR